MLLKNLGIVSLSCSCSPSFIFPSALLYGVYPKTSANNFRLYCYRGSSSIRLSSVLAEHQEQSDCFPSQESRPALTHRFSAHCGEMRHTLITTANVRRGARRGRTLETHRRQLIPVRSHAFAYADFLPFHLAFVLFSIALIRPVFRLWQRKQQEGSCLCCPQ